MLESIFSSIQNLQKDVSRCNDHMSLFESRLEQNERELSMDTAVNYGAISLLDSEDLSNEVVYEEQAQSPQNVTFKSPVKAIKPSISAVPDMLVTAASKENTDITSACYEPDARSTSCKTLQGFLCLLGKELQKEAFVRPGYMRSQQCSRCWRISFSFSGY